MGSPGKILVAGDWHGNVAWMLHAVEQSRTLLPRDGNRRLILQLGDFGIGFMTGAELTMVNDALVAADAETWFADGNHDDHDAIARWQDGLVPGCSRIRHLARGHRWTWHGRDWLACGGAASPDRAYRQQQMNAGWSKPCWWPGEYVTDGDVRRCAAGGHADVLVSHDRPARAAIALPAWPPCWSDADQARCAASRERLQEICDAVTPQHVIHGHYHLPFSCGQHDLGYGPVTVSQLDMDGTAGNLRALDVVSMEWEAAQVAGI